MVAATTNYSTRDPVHRRTWPCVSEAEPVEVIDGDCLAVALQLKAAGYNPVVLNMANRKHPGGGWRNGAGAQEESICRRTNYHESLEAEVRCHPSVAITCRLCRHTPQITCRYVARLCGTRCRSSVAPTAPGSWSFAVPKLTATLFFRGRSRWRC
jgi:hypothetical protein